MVEANMAQARNVEIDESEDYAHLDYAHMTEQQLDERLALAKIDPRRTIEAIQQLLQEKLATK